jgi:hypothetical protein
VLHTYRPFFQLMCGQSASPAANAAKTIPTAKAFSSDPHKANEIRKLL